MVGILLWMKSKNNGACPIRTFKHLQPFINQTHNWQLHLSDDTHIHTHTSPPSLWYHLRSPMKPGFVTQPDYAPLPHYPASPRVSGYPVQLWPAHTIYSWIFHRNGIMHVQSHMITAIIFRKTISALRGKLQSSVELMEEKCLHLPRKGKMDIRI